ncbi:hypothetical protein Dimus_000125 [Dionaea muscipula]
MEDGPSVIITESKMVLLSEASARNHHHHHHHSFLYPMCFGVSCALFALELLSKQELDDERWAETRERMLQRGAHLLGVLVWRWQREEVNEKGLLGKLEAAEREIEELKKRRSEDAKGNEKVAGIYAAKQRCWLEERKKLQQQIGRLLNDVRVLRNKRDEAVSELKKKEEVVSQLNGKLQEMEVLVESKDKAFGEEEEKMKELEDKLKDMATAVEELKENVKRDAQAHFSELWRHKTAFIEMVSNQRQLEAQLGRAVRHAETSKKKLEFVFKEKEESMMMVQNLSIELEKMSKDLEHKDKILSVMLREYKLDKEEKQMLLKEVKASKAKKKQQLEKVKARNMNMIAAGSRNEKRTLKSVLSRPLASRLEVFPGERGGNSILIGLLNAAGRTKPKENDTKIEYGGGGGGYSAESDQSLSDENEEPASQARPPLTSKCVRTQLRMNAFNENEDSPGQNCELKPSTAVFFFSFTRINPGEIDEDHHHRQLSTDDAKRLEGWVWAGAGKYHNHGDIDERHHQLELEAFAEQMRLKDDKLEAYRWRLLSMELESKRLNSHIEGLDQGMSRMRHDIINLETLLLERDREIKTLKGRINSFYLKNSPNSQQQTTSSELLHQLPLSSDDLVWSRVKVIKKKPEPDDTEQREEVGTESSEYDNDTGALAGRSSIDDCECIKEVALESEVQQQPAVSVCEEITSPKEEASHEKYSDIMKNKSRWKMDLHALGVSYKIKRLKQQLLMLERLTEKQENREESVAGGGQKLNRLKGLHPLLALLIKQVNRYQSLQEKIDDIFNRMHENELCVAKAAGGTSSTALTRTKEETRKLGNLFLEETFQLQRFVVATGQKLMEMQAKMASTFVGTNNEEELDDDDDDGSAISFDLTRFADNVRTLFGEVQRGIEVRIARIIGDLEGTMAFDGINYQLRSHYYDNDDNNNNNKVEEN